MGERSVRVAVINHDGVVLDTASKHVSDVKGWGRGGAGLS